MRLLALLLICCASSSVFAKQAIIFNKSKTNDIEVRYKFNKYQDGKGWSSSPIASVMIPAKKSIDSKNYVIIIPEKSDDVIEVISAVATSDGRIISEGSFQPTSQEISFACTGEFYRERWTDRSVENNASIELDDNDNSPLITCSSKNIYFNDVN